VLATDISDRLSGRTLLAAVLVVAVGAVLGAAGFTIEQSRATWRPHVVRTATGWRVTQPYLGINQPQLAGEHVAWQAGPYTITMELGGGRAKLIGVAHDAQSLWPPAVSTAGVVWLETAGGPVQTRRVYSYGFSSHRRRLLLETQADLQPPVVSGPTACWLRGVGHLTGVVACDLTSGQRRVLATGRDLGPFLLAGEPHVAWSRQPQSEAPFTITVLDTTDGTTRTVALPGQTSGAVFDTPILAKGTLVWLRVNKTRLAAITAYDLSTFTATQVATGVSLSAPAFDGTTVVWAQLAPGGGDELVMGRHLASDKSFQIARVHGAVQSVMVSGPTVAWWVAGDNAAVSWIETTRLPQ
jgi:hypothetical protein